MRSFLASISHNNAVITCFTFGPRLPSIAYLANVNLASSDTNVCTCLIPHESLTSDWFPIQLITWGLVYLAFSELSGLSPCTWQREDKAGVSRTCPCMYIALVRLGPCVLTGTEDGSSLGRRRNRFGKWLASSCRYCLPLVLQF